MPGVLLRQPNGKTKPPIGAGIDRTHPLAQGLVFAVPLNEGGGLAFEVVNGIQSSSNATERWVDTPGGLSGGFYITPRRNPNPPFTWAAWGYVPGSATGYSSLLGNEYYVSGPQGGVNLQTQQGRTTMDWLVCRAGGSSAMSDNSTTGVHLWIGIYDGTNSYFYRDGTAHLYGSAATAYTAPPANQNIYGGGGADNSVFPLAAYVWERVLTPGEIWQLWVEPYSVFESATPHKKFWLPSAVSTPATISFVQNLGGASANTVALTANAHAGNAVFAAIKTSGGAKVTGVTDTQGNTWFVDAWTGGTLATGALARTNQDKGTLTSADSVTVSYSAVNTASFQLFEFSGLDGNGPDKVATAVSGTNAVSMSTTMTSQVNEVAISVDAIGGSATWTAPTGWSDLGGVGYQDVAYLVLSAQQTVSASWTAPGAGNSAGIIATYRAEVPVAGSGSPAIVLGSGGTSSAASQVSAPTDLAGTAVATSGASGQPTSPVQPVLASSASTSTAAGSVTTTAPEVFSAAGTSTATGALGGAPQFTFEADAASTGLLAITSTTAPQLAASNATSDAETSLSAPIPQQPQQAIAVSNTSADFEAVSYLTPQTNGVSWTSSPLFIASIPLTLGTSASTSSTLLDYTVHMPPLTSSPTSSAAVRFWVDKHPAAIIVVSAPSFADVVTQSLPSHVDAVVQSAPSQQDVVVVEAG